MLKKFRLKRAIFRINLALEEVDNLDGTVNILIRSHLKITLMHLESLIGSYTDERR